jgi:hypothetical protein
MASSTLSNFFCEHGKGYISPFETSAFFPLTSILLAVLLKLLAEYAMETVLRPRSPPENTVR